MSHPAAAAAPPTATPVPMADAAVQLWQRTGAPLLLPVTGTSMLPLLRPGDQVVVTPGGQPYPVGALIVFPQAGQLVVHRVVRRLARERRLLTKGDHGPFDPPILATEVIGVVTAIERAGVRHALDNWGWRLWGWLIAQTATRPAYQRRLLRLAARHWARSEHQ